MSAVPARAGPGGGFGAAGETGGDCEGIMIARAERRSWGAAAAAALLVAASPGAASSQAVFDVRHDSAALAEAAEDTLGVGELARLLVREGSLVYRGEAPAEVRLVAYLVGPGGELVDSVGSAPVRIEPGEHRLARFVTPDLYVRELGDALPSRLLLHGDDGAERLSDSAWASPLPRPEERRDIASRLRGSRDRVLLWVTVVPAGVALRPGVRGQLSSPTLLLLGSI